MIIWVTVCLIMQMLILSIADVPYVTRFVSVCYSMNLDNQNLGYGQGRIYRNINIHVPVIAQL